MASNYPKIVGMLVGFLIAIIIGVMVYWAFVDSNTQFDSSTTEVLEQDTYGVSFSRAGASATSGSNYSGVIVEIDYIPYSITTVEAWNGTGGGAVQTLTEGTGEGNWQLNGRLLYIKGDSTGTGSSLTNFTQINVTYASQVGQAVSGAGGVNAQADTTFGLLPVIAIVVVASIILFVILGFGSGGGRKT